MKVLITGANGMLGKDLSQVLLQNNHEVINTDYKDMDITNQHAVDSVLNHHIPDLVIHCAAYTNVDLAETEKEKAFLLNETGSQNLANTTSRLNIPIVAISTDYVFDGTKKGQYEPGDITCPINIYGESKKAAEDAIIATNPQHYIVRTSWLYGIHGKNFVETMIELSQKMPELKVVDDQVGCPTWTVALSNGILNLLNNNSKYGIYHVCGSESTSWYGFAKKIFELENINTKLSPCATSEFPRPAKRPHNSTMNNNGLCPHWEESLKEYLKLRSNI